MTWIASHKQFLSHPKTLDLMEYMGWDVDQCVAKLHRLWWWCVDYAEDGDLRKHNDDRIARAVGLNGGNDATRFVEGLVTARWLDREPYFRIHDWWDYYGHFLRGKYSKTPEKWQRIRDLYSPSVNHTVTARLPFTTEPNQTKQNKTKRNYTPPKETKNVSLGAPTQPKFVPPTPQEAADYARSLGFDLDGEKFVAHYSASGWVRRGGVKIKDWRAAVVTWKKNDGAFTPKGGSANGQFPAWQR